MSSSADPSSRRAFLRHLIALLPPLSFGGCVPFEASRNVRAPAFASRYFTWAEFAFLHAACARLIPSDQNGPGAVELGVLEFIDRQLDGAFGHAATWYMQGPFVNGLPEFGYQSALTPREVYRAGIAAVDAHCRRSLGGKPFCELSSVAQDAVLADLESGALDFEGVSGSSFFGFLLQNTKEGYLADPIHGGNKRLESWKLIGFPGARADFIDWVGKHGAHYTQSPVGIASGKEGLNHGRRHETPGRRGARRLWLDRRRHGCGAHRRRPRGRRARARSSP